MTMDGWDRTLELNLRSQALTCRAVVRQMLVQPLNSSGTRGSILLMGSVTATDPSPEMFGTHAYAAAKGATNALMAAMAATYANDRIRVNAVAPSLTDTPMATRARGDPRIRAYAARKQPLAGEMLDPAEVAHAAVYFMSDESRAVTGQLLKVDGGWSVVSASPEGA
jgi:NAD(P)-dependent dehydrogenase (short-subunit alcohol dehydrogenase family)